MGNFFGFQDERFRFLLWYGSTYLGSDLVSEVAELVSAKVVVVLVLVGQRVVSLQ